MVSIGRVGSLPLKNDKRSTDFLDSLYNHTKSLKDGDGFKYYYENMLKQAIDQEKKENPKAGGSGPPDDKTKGPSVQNPGQPRTDSVI